MSKPDPTLVNGKKVYQLWYRKGYNTPEFVIFNIDGDIKLAIEKGKAFCEKTGTRFCGVKLGLVDLEELAKSMMEVTV